MKFAKLAIDKETLIDFGNFSRSITNWLTFYKCVELIDMKFGADNVLFSMNSPSPFLYQFILVLST